MSGANNPFEKYLAEGKGLGHFLKQPRSWVMIVTLFIGILVVYLAYKYLIVEKMSAEELNKSIEIVWLDTKWVEKDVTPHSVKIVPTVAFKFKNVGSRPLQYVNFEGVFEFADTGRVHTDGIASACQQPLVSGGVSDEVFIRAFFGYSATSKQAFLQNIEEWKRMNVKIFANSKGSGHVRIGNIYPVKQVIEGMEEETEQVKEDLEKDAKKITRSIQVVWHDSLWLDRKVTTGKAIIVPSIKIKVKNISAAPLQYLYLKGIFEFVETGEILTQGLASALDEPLPPAQTSEELLIKGEFGYQASSKAAFIRNIQNWRRVQVKILAKIKDSNYVLLATYPIKREIEGVRVRYH